jgi:hypothetical protein
VKRVYFIRPVGHDGPIKIGCSQDSDKRLYALQMLSPLRLETICAVPGEHHHENAIHHMFAAHRRHGEWFEATPEVLAFVEKVLASGCLPPLNVLQQAPRTAGSMSKRVTPETLRRSKITAAVSRAERHGFGFANRERMRPDDVAAIFARWQYALNAQATDEETAILTGYIDRLLAMPKADTSLKSWYEWHDQACAGQAA